MNRKAFIRIPVGANTLAGLGLGDCFNMHLGIILAAQMRPLRCASAIDHDSPPRGNTIIVEVEVSINGSKLAKIREFFDGTCRNRGTRDQSNSGKSKWGMAIRTI